MIAIDNSEYMRNGDFLTSRYEAQLTATEFIFKIKLIQTLKIQSDY